MKDYQNILFDLDGTLIDPKEGITNSVKYALSYFGIFVQNTEELYKFIGPPLQESFPQYYGFNEKDTQIAIEKYREHFREKGIFQNVLYEGIPELLEELVEAKKTVILATSKPEVFSIQILEHLNLKKYFSDIGGATFDHTRSKKEEVIQHVIKTNHLSVENTVMVGDRSYDIIGAKKNHMDSIGVLYGYGNEEELKKVGATYMVENVMELQSQLLGSKE